MEVPSGQKLFQDLPIPDSFVIYDEMETLILDGDEEQIPEIVKFIKENFNDNEYEQCYLTVINFCVMYPTRLRYFGLLYVQMMEKIGKYPITYTLVHLNIALARFVYLHNGYSLQQFQSCSYFTDLYAKYFGSDTTKGLSEDQLLKFYEDDTLQSIIFHDDIDKLVQVSSLPNFDFNQRLKLNDCHFNINFEVSLIGFACLYGSVQCFKYLKLSTSGISHDTAGYAIIGGNYEIIHICIREIGSGNILLTNAIQYHKNGIADWLLMNTPDLKATIDAALYGFNTRAVYFYITEPLRASTRFVKYDYDVTLAASIGYSLLLRYYVENNKKFFRSLWNDPMLSASMCRSFESIKILKDSGFKGNLIHIAAFGDDIELAKLFIKESSQKDMETAMESCIKVNAVNVARILFENGYVSNVHHHMPSSEMKALFDQYSKESNEEEDKNDEE
ncbi:hypothetical protein TVAG_057160 [Trichomonas vaginalis G3]|uniref:DUF3447 domain-containing protein n=1 Tax=Trichomonas vaginalis (strain ATCC PRA-98 / G3) TaxID=412133 RepID=A2EKC4_TRIV3|nr:ankyrin repeat and SOCS box-containing protein 4 family [Trichomonas vaginalis G3]EAY06922.1 hypothetical protein TVAG_057160 [Trichomonas vaginalis G3]KAI5513913.1 ankyrin repeat and SOCS box-containing protein 4 family [Trichomonas vaginalis G3]|eukprot:XP_001319145.1 hypothetical protein [Trichomonas vaginalis G3]